MNRLFILIMKFIKLKKENMNKLFSPLFIGFILIGCHPPKQNNQSIETADISIEIPDFDADSAYVFLVKQVEFTPRVPNTKAHKDCAAFLINTLGRFADTVISQPITAKAYNGTLLNGQNIVGVFNPEARRRILLAAHWDSRPYADHDPDPANRRTPIDGANDGASGVAVLLEVARQLRLNPVETGIDIVFFDLEDYGAPEDERTRGGEDFWCLGAQAWAKNPHVKNYQAQYGILLDMVGGKGAQFSKEAISMEYAPDIVEKVWYRAKLLGFDSYFLNKTTSQILDDHWYINTRTNIPMIDIIEYEANSNTGFNQHWHTLSDNFDNIDKETLSVVGKVMLSVLRSEK